MLNWWRERWCSENQLRSGIAFRVRHNPTTVRAARELARQLLIQYATQDATGIAQASGITIRRDEWIVASGQVIFLAECSWQPPEIILNQATLRMIAARVRTAPALISGQAEEWFTENRIAEVVIAHELYHLITQQPSAPSVETAAHAFAEELLHLPFSPKLYETLLISEC